MITFREYLAEAKIKEVNEQHRYYMSKEDDKGVLVFDNREELEKHIPKKGLKELAKAETILDSSNPTKAQLWDVFGTIFNGSLEEHWVKWSKHMSK